MHFQLFLMPIIACKNPALFLTCKNHASNCLQVNLSMANCLMQIWAKLARRFKKQSCLQIEVWIKLLAIPNRSFLEVVSVEVCCGKIWKEIAKWATKSEIGLLMPRKISIELCIHKDNDYGCFAGNWLHVIVMGLSANYSCMFLILLLCFNPFLAVRFNSKSKLHRIFS